MRYIASLISGVGIFMMGAGLSWYHGIIGLLHPQPIESLLWVRGVIVFCIILQTKLGFILIIVLYLLDPTSM